MAHQVFICHSARDKAVADAACAALEADGIACWIAPRDVLGGEEWGKSIIEALTGCSIVVLIFSAHADESPQVRREIERAVSKGKIILPFRIQDVLPSDAMEYALSNTHWLDAMTPPMELRLSELCQTVARLMELKQSGKPLPRTGTAKEADGTGLDRVQAAATVIPEGAFALGQHGAPDASVRDSVRRKAWLWSLGVAPLVALGLLGWLIPWHDKQAVIEHRDPHQSALQMKPCDGSRSTNCGQDKVDAGSGGEISPDDAQGSLRYRKSCDGGDASACTNLGFLFSAGRGVAKDDEQAAALFLKGCTAGDAKGCTSLGIMYDDGRGVAKDASQAAALYRKGCEGGYAEGCTNLGAMYEDGTGVLKGDAQAGALYRRGCDGGNALGCTDLGVLYEDGKGIAKDPRKAATFYQKGCDEDDARGCCYLGDLYGGGTGVTRDEIRAAKLYQKACDGKFEAACDHLKNASQ